MILIHGLKLRIKMLILEKFIGKGATRICFEHPADSNKCIRVAVRYKEEYLLERELKAYQRIKVFLDDYLVEYEDKLIDTKLGKGIVSELLRDDNNQYSKTLDQYVYNAQLKEKIVAQVIDFAQRLFAHDIFFYDFNLENFIVQIKNGEPYLKYTDLKSFEKYKPWTYLKLEKVIKPLARHLMKRRIKKLFKYLDIDTAKVF